MHEVAQGADPSCRVVYVDNDPVVASHARAGLRSAPEGTASYLDADARDTAAILAAARATLDLTQPVGVILIDILNFLEDAADVVARLVAAVPAGSYLVVMHAGQGRADRRRRAALEPGRAEPALPARPGTGRPLARRPQPGAAGPGRRERLAAGRATDPACPGGVPLLGVVARKP